MLQRSLDLYTDLNAAELPTRTKACRHIKNIIIGSNHKKEVFMKLGAIDKLVEMITKETDEKLLVEALTALGSFAHGTKENVQTLCNLEPIPSLLRLIAHTNSAIVEAAARTLQILLGSRVTPKEDFFKHKEAIPLVVGLLQNSNETIVEMGAKIISRSCCSDDHQDSFGDASAIQCLLNILYTNYPKTIEAALHAIAALTCNNQKICGLVTSTEGAIERLMDLAMGGTPLLSLASAHCLTELSVAGFLEGESRDASKTILLVLAKLLDEKDVVERVPLVLARLMKEDANVQRMAVEEGLLGKLAALLIDSTSSNRMKESALNGIAVMFSKHEESKKPAALGSIVERIPSFLRNEETGIRLAACRCTNNFSRSLKGFTATLMTTGIITPLLELLSDSTTEIQKLSSATICSAVPESAALKKLVLEQGVTRLLPLLSSMEFELRLNAVWTLSNVSHKANPTQKGMVLKALNYSTIALLASDPEPKVQAQSFCLLRNLIIDNLEEFGKAITVEEITTLLSKALTSGTDDTIVLTEILNTMSHLCDGDSSEYRQAIMDSNLYEVLIKILDVHSVEVQVVALRCIFTLTSQEYLRFEERVAKFKEKGCHTKLEELVNDARVESDVRNRARSVLQNFS